MQNLSRFVAGVTIVAACTALVLGLDYQQRGEQSASGWVGKLIVAVVSADWWDQAADIVTVIGLPVAIVALILAYRQDQRIREDLTRHPVIELGFGEDLQRTQILKVPFKEDQIWPTYEFSIYVKNVGRRSARNVVVSVSFPQGLAMSDREIGGLGGRRPRVRLDEFLIFGMYEFSAITVLHPRRGERLDGTLRIDPTRIGQVYRLLFTAWFDDWEPIEQELTLTVLRQDDASEPSN